MPFGFGWSKVAVLILQYAPQAIDVVERIFGKGGGSTKRIAAAKDVVETINEFLEHENYFELPKVDKAALVAAVKDEELFVEAVARLNDAVVTFTNFINSYKTIP